jgi:hypothetical protein
MKWSTEGHHGDSRIALCLRRELARRRRARSPPRAAEEALLFHKRPLAITQAAESND